MLCECSERIREQTDALLQCLDDHIGAWNVCAELWMTDKASVCLQVRLSLFIHFSDSSKEMLRSTNRPMRPTHRKTRRCQPFFLARP